MTNPAVTTLVRARLSRLTDEIRLALSAADIARRQHEMRAEELRELQDQHADLMAFLHVHGEATPDELQRLQNVVMKTTWPGKKPEEERSDN